MKRRDFSKPQKVRVSYPQQAVIIPQKPITSSKPKKSWTLTADDFLVAGILVIALAALGYWFSAHLLLGSTIGLSSLLSFFLLRKH